MQDKSYIFTFSMKNFLPFEVLRSSVKTLDFFFPLANSVIVFLLYVVLYFVTIGLRLFFPARLNEFRILWESFFGERSFSTADQRMVNSLASFSLFLSMYTLMALRFLGRSDAADLMELMISSA